MQSIFSITINTFRESIRSKILYTLILFALVIVLLAAFFGKVSIGDPSKILKDFGMMSISFSSVIFVVIAGSLMLYKELSRKTIYNILSKPVLREHFLIGKYIGMLLTVSTLTFLLGLFFSVFMYFYDGYLDYHLLQGYFFILLELTILSAFSIFFSAIVVTPLLSGLFTFCIFLAGRSSQYIIEFAELVKSSLIKYIYWILPHFDGLYVGNEIVYRHFHSLENTLWSVVYAFSYSAVLITISCFFFRKREFNGI